MTAACPLGETEAIKKMAQLIKTDVRVGAAFQNLREQFLVAAHNLLQPQCGGGIHSCLHQWGLKDTDEESRPHHQP